MTPKATDYAFSRIPPLREGVCGEQKPLRRVRPVRALDGAVLTIRVTLHPRVQSETLRGRDGAKATPATSATLPGTAGRHGQSARPRGRSNRNGPCQLCRDRRGRTRRKWGSGAEDCERVEDQ